MAPNKPINIRKTGELLNKEIIHEYKSSSQICNYCGRTSQNEIRCIGRCVADSDY